MENGIEEFKGVFQKQVEEELHEHCIWIKGNTYPELKYHYCIVTATIWEEDEFVLGLIPFGWFGPDALKPKNIDNTWVTLRISADKVDEYLKREVEVCADKQEPFKSEIEKFKEIMKPTYDMLNKLKHEHTSI